VIVVTKGIVTVLTFRRKEFNSLHTDHRGNNALSERQGERVKSSRASLQPDDACSSRIFVAVVSFRFALVNYSTGTYTPVYLYETLSIMLSSSYLMHHISIVQPKKRDGIEFFGELQKKA
jgi:hypothetical protein